MSLVQFILVGFAAGWIMGRIRRGHGYGLFGNIIIGGVGALIGNFVGGFLNMSPAHIAGSIAMAVVGAVVLFLIIDAVRPRSGRSKGESEE